MEVTVPQSFSIPVHEASQVGEARREAALFAARLDLDQDTIGRVSIAATEAARNLHLHGGGGEILISSLRWRNQPCLELLALDRGAGMADLEKCMRDGYSTAGTPGTGLGSIARLADAFDVYSRPGQGTVLMGRFLSRVKTHPRAPEALEYSVACVAYSGEPVCGDAWATRDSANGQSFFLVDGLGHGPYAEQAALEAVRVFHDSNGAGPGEIIERSHSALRATRGAAVAVARIDLQRQSVMFAGIGNISALTMIDGASHYMVSLNGTVGHQIHKVKEFVYPWTGNALLIMHSDGLVTRWDLQSYPGLLQRSTGVIAGILYRDFNRHRDDVTVLVARLGKGQPT